MPEPGYPILPAKTSTKKTRLLKQRDAIAEHLREAFATNARSVKPRPKGQRLGIDTDDTIHLVRLVRAGFEFSRLQQFQKVTGLSLEKIARFAQIPQQTLSRRQTEGRLHADESDRLLRLSMIFDLAVDL
ncbi:MAG: hypothetical protein HYU36_22860 [Planctomycetes bacterium]|nr:hypothetical protein [Planctomycetota bacterium]